MNNDIKIAVAGTGYVGLSIATLLSQHHHVTAVDVVLIQRNEILNSGNLPLGFSAGKVVVGPSVGNVGSTLEETGNPTFKPNDESSLIQAVSRGFQLSDDSNKIGEANYQKATTEWSKSKVSDIINNNLFKIIEL